MEFDSSQAPQTVAAGSAVREPGRPESGPGDGALLPLADQRLSQKLGTKAHRGVGSGNAFSKPGKHRKTLLPHEWTALGTCVDPIEVNGYL